MNKCASVQNHFDLAKVCGVDLRDASHDQAVEAIRRAGDSVVFLVQAGQHRSQVLQNKIYIRVSLVFIMLRLCRYECVTLCCV